MKKMIEELKQEYANFNSEVIEEKNARVYHTIEGDELLIGLEDENENAITGYDETYSLKDEFRTNENVSANAKKLIETSTRQELLNIITDIWGRPAYNFNKHHQELYYIALKFPKANLEEIIKKLEKLDALRREVKKTAARSYPQWSVCKPAAPNHEGLKKQVEKMELELFGFQHMVGEGYI